jgi:Xaa-Pro dipeptidase
MTELSSLYAAHLQMVLKVYADGLERAGFDSVIIGSGAERFQAFDDRPYVFAVNPHFKYFVPLTEHPQCWISYTPGNKPVLVYFQPEDYWHLAPAQPSGYWVEHFDIRIVRTAGDAKAELFAPDSARVAIIGENDAGLDGFAPNNPAALLNYVHFYRAYKSDYELACMRHAQVRAVRGHAAAERAFHAQGSEYDIHMAYVLATGQCERQLPYSNIVALNQHCAVLHYQHQRHDKPLEHYSFLIDAGASHLGYAADITRTYARHDGTFSAIIAALERAQLRLVDLVRVGNTNSQIHLAAHAEVAQILHDFKLINMSAEAIQAQGITHHFFPHGIGHYLGLQVHDVGGYSKDDAGTAEPKPVGHKYLRLTRELRGNEVITIEPGIYFIELLLSELQASPNAGLVDWTLIDALKHYGGIRIEDNVRTKVGSAPENLTRDAFAALG